MSGMATSLNGSYCRLKINWEPTAWDEYVEWQTIDKAILKRINRMISPFKVIQHII